MPEPEYVQSWDDQIRLSTPKRQDSSSRKISCPRASAWQEQNLLLDTERPGEIGRLAVRRHQREVGWAPSGITYSTPGEGNGRLIGGRLLL